MEGCAAAGDAGVGRVELDVAHPHAAVPDIRQSNSPLVHLGGAWARTSSRAEGGAPASSASRPRPSHKKGKKPKTHSGEARPNEVDLDRIKTRSIQTRSRQREVEVPAAVIDVRGDARRNGANRVVVVWVERFRSVFGLVDIWGRREAVRMRRGGREGGEEDAQVALLLSSIMSALGFEPVTMMDPTQVPASANAASLQN